MHLVRLRTSAKNRTFGLLSQWGVRVKLARLRQPDAIELLERRGVPEVWRQSVAEALCFVDWLDERIAPLDRDLRPLAAADERAGLLATIPGLGAILGLTFAVEIGDVARRILTLCFYGLRDGEIRCLAPRAGARAVRTLAVTS